MDHFKADTWTLTTGSPTITSTFTLNLVDGHSPLLGSPPISTERRGIGYKFVIHALNDDVKRSLCSGVEIQKRTMFRICFVPGHIANSKLDLQIAVIVDGTILPSERSGDQKAFHSLITLPCTRSMNLATYRSSVNFTGEALLEIRVELPTNFDLAPIDWAQSTRKVQSVLADSLMGAELSDMKFCLFTQRQGHDGVGKPKILFANKSLILGQVPFLDDFVSNADAHIVTAEDLSEQTYSFYDYLSDSDLDPDEEESEFDDSLDFESQTSSSAPGSGNKVPPQAMSRNEDDKDVLFIPGIAFNTWKAFIYYLYTKEVYFKPLTSDDADSSTESETMPHCVTCSPKSMYRLTCKVGCEELKNLSLHAIASSLSENNIVEELFSSFTSKYPEVQEAEVKILIPLLKKTTVVEVLLTKIRTITTKGVPHCADIVSVTFQHLVALANDEHPCMTCLEPLTEGESGKKASNSDDDDLDELWGHLKLMTV